MADEASTERATYTWYGSFRDREKEAAFLKFALPRDRSTTYVIGWVLLIVSALFVLNDIRVYSMTESLPLFALGSRAIVFVYVVLGLSTIGKLESRNGLDWIAFGMALLLVLHTFAVNLSRPTDYYASAGVDVMTLAGLLMAAPFWVPTRLVCAWILTAGLLAIHFGYKDLEHEIVTLSVCLALVGMNAIGFVCATGWARGRRDLYTLLAREQALNAALNDALDHVKVLSGMIPICARCKKIRNDEGFWEQVEIYVRKRSDVEFSHSLCPECKTDFLVESGMGEAAPSE